MKLAKKLVTLAMALTLAVSSLAVGAAPSPTGTDISAATGKASNQTYTGKKQAAKFTVTYGGETLVEGTDFTIVKGAKAQSVGNHAVTIQGIGKFTGTLRIPYVIKKASVAKKYKKTIKVKKATKTTKKKTAQISKKASWAKTAGKLSVKVKSGKLSASKAAKYFSKSGKNLVIKKGLAKGKYVVVVNYETKNYKIKRTFTITVKK